MARTTRKVLDLALVSLDTIRPAISNKWCTTKNYVKDTRAEPLLFNPIVEKVESAVAKAERMLCSKLMSIRDQQMLAEVRYLERQLDEAKKRLVASKTLKGFGVTSWKYLKIEAVPPMTVSFFNGPAGRKMEAFVGKLTNGFIAAIQNKIKEIDEEEERNRRELIAAMKAREAKLLAEAKKKEAERLKAVAQKAAEAVKKAAALAEKQKIEMEAAKAKEEAQAKPKDKRKTHRKPKGKKKTKSPKKKRRPRKKK